MRVTGTRVDDPTTDVRRESSWVSLLWAALVWWVKVAARLVVWVVRAWTLTGPAALLALVWAWWGRLAALGVPLVGLLVLLVWWRRWPDRFADLVVARVRGRWRWRTVYGWHWWSVMDGVGLTRKSPTHAVYVPTVVRVRSTRVVDRLDVRLLHGHTPQDVSAVAEGLRHSFGAHRCQVAETGPGRVRVTFYARDPLLVPLPPVVPGEAVDMAALPVGLCEDGRPYLLRLAGTHLLIAGTTGAGKGSVLWSIIAALAPGIAEGSVRLRGADPKGGMELFPGRALFTDYQDESGGDIATMLEDAVADMNALKAKMKTAGLRAFKGSRAEPWNVIVVDELAVLTAYGDKDVAKRVKDAMSVLLSQGRAVGFIVIAALQDPSKDVLSFRDLLPTRVALRLMSESQAEMSLGDGAVARGARCHDINPTLPGVGFVRIEGVIEPVRVRFTYLTDEDIRALAAKYAAPCNVTGPGPDTVAGPVVEDRPAGLALAGQVAA